ncbi:MAG: hypothetical protein GXP25_15685 [Planctomycetes bacterium]|nr:hypothetical protein [Planctomycetota bacterium]
MKSIRVAALLIVLLGSVLFAGRSALAADPKPYVTYVFQKDGTPYPLVWCGGCKRETCQHRLEIDKKKSWETWTVRVGGREREWGRFKDWKYINPPLKWLKRGGTVIQWTRHIEFKGSKCACSCKPKTHGKCKGRYPCNGEIELSLRHPITLKDYEKSGTAVVSSPTGLTGKKVKKWDEKVSIPTIWKVKLARLTSAACKCCKPPPEKKPEGKKKKVAMRLSDWPGTEGVLCTFVPSGENYGNIGDLAITNTTDQAISVTVPDGLLLDSSDAGVQDLYVADVPSRTPCAGATEIGKPIIIGAGETHVINDIPGFCPDFELKPPAKGASDAYTTRQPDEKAATLLATIEAVKKFDMGTLKLQVFEKDQTREMLAQGALWMVDSRVDEVKGNEVSNENLGDRYWDKFRESAADALAKMSPKQREEAEDLVKEDIKKIVAATSFVSKDKVPG